MESVEAFAEHGFYEMRLSGMVRAAGREEFIFYTEYHSLSYYNVR